MQESPPRGRFAATALAYEPPIATGDEQLITVARAFGIELVAP